MAIHYSANQESVACGRSGASLESTQNMAEVSCKLCLRTVEKKVAEPVRKTPSLADLRAAAKAEKAAAMAQEASREAVSALVSALAPASVSAPVAAAVATPAKTSARAEWQQRLAQMPGRNRLPRGASRQSFT